MTAAIDRVASHDARRILNDIMSDAKADVERFEGQPFTGKTVAEYMGCQAAAISMLAHIVRGLLPADPRPETWPPKPGDVWEDRNGDRWICTPVSVTNAAQHRYLTCLARFADDSAEEIWRVHGPLKLVIHVDTTDMECPF